MSSKKRTEKKVEHKIELGNKPIASASKRQPSIEEKGHKPTRPAPKRGK